MRGIMKKLLAGTVCSLCMMVLHAQSVKSKLETATTALLADPQMKHAIMCMKLVNSETGELVFELNSETGLAPASCQKIITSATAMELLGPGFRYKTEVGYDGYLINNKLKGNIHITGYGDPTMGSWRYKNTRDSAIMRQLTQTLQARGIRRLKGALIGHTQKWETNTVPGGWPWDDIGNYYGAGTSALNWHENQFDIILNSGSQIGDSVHIVKSDPELYHVQLVSELTAADKSSGDNSIVYTSPLSNRGYLRGTIPAGEQAFVVAASMPDPPMQLLSAFAQGLAKADMKPTSFNYITEGVDTANYQSLYTYLSPTLDSINYWFMKKSINFYGETLLKTIAYEKTGFGSTEKGLEIVKQFWKERGIDPAGLRMIDGSGLSPQNHITVDALVKILQYARTRPWFPYYYDALPVYNNMKLKSGTIGGVKGFAGYHKAKDGTTYTVALLINNYSGSTNDIVKKMFVVLDELK